MPRDRRSLRGVPGVVGSSPARGILPRALAIAMAWPPKAVKAGRQARRSGQRVGEWSDASIYKRSFTQFSPSSGQSVLNIENRTLCKEFMQKHREYYCFVSKLICYFDCLCYNVKSLASLFNDKEGLSQRLQSSTPDFTYITVVLEAGADGI